MGRPVAIHHQVCWEQHCSLKAQAEQTLQRRKSGLNQIYIILHIEMWPHNDITEIQSSPLFGIT